MYKLSFAEKMHRAFMSGSTPEIKGSTKITLTDPKTGAREVYQDENMVTNAISRIYNSNYLGVTDYYNYIPMLQFFGGVFCFAQPLTEDANNMWPANQSISAMTANAGQTPYSGPNPTRGNPDGGSTVVTDDHIRFVWEWGMSKGSGSISCVCLTHQLAGDCGLLPDGSMPLINTTGRALPNINSYTADLIDNQDLSRARCIAMPVTLDNNGMGLSLYFDGTSLEEITVAHSWVTSCLLETNKTMPLDSSNYREISSRTATLSRTFDTGYTFLAQDESYYYIMERDASAPNKLYINEIDKSDFSVNGYALDSLGVNMARTSANNPSRYCGIVSGRNVYWISNTNAKNFVRINLDNTADVEELTTNLTSNISMQQTPFIMSDGLILGRNYLINGSTVYPVTARTPRKDGSGSSYEMVAYDIFAKYKNGPHVLQSGHTWTGSTYNRCGQGGVLALPYLATINNLTTPVTKTNSKAMQIEYTLTEV